jgi:hypothetical protein
VKSLEQKWTRVQRNVQQAILASYPHPDRNGCADGVALLDLTRRAAELGTLEGDERWEHVTHCSPCYKEYLEARDHLRQPRDGDQGGKAVKK